MAGDSGAQKGPLDGMYKDMFWLGILLSVCCNPIGLILAIVGVVTGKDPQSTGNAKICMYISIGLTILGCVIGIIQLIIAIGAAAAGG